MACWPLMPAPASSSAASSRIPRARRSMTACWRWDRRIFRACSPAAEPEKASGSALDLPPAAIAQLADLPDIAVAAAADHEGLAVFAADPVALGDWHVAHDLGESVAAGIGIRPFDGMPDRASLDGVPQCGDLRYLVVGGEAAARVGRLDLELRHDVDFATGLVARQPQQRLCHERPRRRDNVAHVLRCTGRQ